MSKTARTVPRHQSTASGPLRRSIPALLRPLRRAGHGRLRRPERAPIGGGGAALRAKTRANARRPKCGRFARVGSFDARATVGANATPFSGRIATKPVKPGAYRALLTATDAAGNSSKQARAKFKVVPRRDLRHE